jgi:hypothetical protein
MSGIDHGLSPILSGIAEDLCSPIEDIEPIATVDVRSGPRSTESQVLGAEGDDMDIRQAK